MLSKAQKEAQAQQRKRFIQYIHDGLNGYEIGDREGMAADMARDKRRDIAREEGLTVKDSKRSQFVPLGLSKVDYNIRAWLGLEVQRLSRLHSRVTLASMLGISPQRQKEAEANKYNWTIAQLYRLAEVKQISFCELLTLSQQGPVIGWEKKK